MSVINALFSTAFLILVAVSAAVTGSMVMLALFDRALRKKKAPVPSLENALERESGDLDQDNRDEIDDGLETIHAEQMRKFGVSQGALEQRRFRRTRRSALARPRELGKQEGAPDLVVGLLVADEIEVASKHR